MAAKLNRDQILRGILRTLVDGWGYDAVKTTLETIDTDTATTREAAAADRKASLKTTAAAQIEELQLPPGRRLLLKTLALSYDEGTAFPKLSDARAFLISHQRDAKEVKSRSQAFKRMLPILNQMSEKGLEKVISRSHHSGPAELDPISKAIRGAGEELRGAVSTPTKLPQEDAAPATEDRLPDGEPGPLFSRPEHKADKNPASAATRRARLSIRRNKPFP